MFRDIFSKHISICLDMQPHYGQKLWHSVLYMRDPCLSIYTFHPGRMSICLVSHVHLLLHISFTKNIEEGMHLFVSLLGSIIGLHRNKGLNITQKEQMLHL